MIKETTKSEITNSGDTKAYDNFVCHEDLKKYVQCKLIKALHNVFSISDHYPGKQ